MKIKTGTKLTAGFILAIFVMAALAFYSINESRQTLEEAVSKGSVLLAEGMLREIDRTIYSKIELLESYIKHLPLQKTVSGSNQKFERLESISAYMDQREGGWVSAPKEKITPFMRELISSQFSNILRREFIDFYQKKYGYKVFGEVFITNKYGANVAQTNKTSDYRQNDEGWWQIAREKGLYVGDIVYDESSGIDAINIGVRVEDEEGNFTGVMKAVLSLKSIIREIEIGTDEYETTRIKLITRDGRLIYSTKAFKPLENVSGKPFYRQIKDQNGFFTATAGGKEWLFSYARSKGYGNFKGLGWVLVVEHQVDEILTFSTALRNRLILASLILIAVVIFIGFYISRSITHRINLLAEGAEIVSRGDLEHSVEVGGKDDIGLLATSFNTMVQDLRETASERERRNWFKRGRSELDDQMRGELTLDELSSRIIIFIANYLKVQIGALYLTENGGNLRFGAGYAYKSSNNFPDKFKFREGLIGQAAFEKMPIHLTNVPDDYIKVASALGEKKPKSILVIPCIHDETVTAVLEIGSFDEFSDLQTAFFYEVSDRISIAITSARSRVEIEKALEVTRQQAEDLKAQQEELKAANEELEEQTQLLRQSEERLRVQQEELQVANEGLAIASRHKSEFLANMSHELRTPLNSLLLLASLLTENQEGNLTEDQVDSANIIYKSGNELLSLIDDILDLSKIEAGRMDLSVEKVSTRDLADRIKADFQHMADEKGLTLEIVVDDNGPADPETDRKRVEQIVKNFMSNAIKFTDKGGISVHLGEPDRNVNLSKSGLNTRNAIAIAVKDTGIGISPEKEEIIFGAFQQGDEGTAKKYGGTGLGLSISIELARLLGGEIQLNTAPGQGSTFILYLPVEKKVVKPRGVKREDVKPKREEISHIPDIPDDRENLLADDITILVIEDDPNFAEMLLNHCHRRGFRCLAAAQGEEGLRLAEKYLPKAVLLDIRLPGIDGWTVLETLKENPKTRHIPVHMMSVEESTIDAFRKGAIGFLEKPVRKDALEAAFGRLEDMFSRKMKDLLVVEDDDNLRKAISKLIGNSDVRTDEAAKGEEAIQALRSKRYDCMILDLGLPDMTGFELLKMAEADNEIVLPPVIVYTGKELTPEENMTLRNYSESIIIKGVRSEERLLDEVSLFLHRAIGEMPPKQQKMITNLRDDDFMFRDRQVLIVDDDMRNLFALSRILEKKGMKVLKAEDGEKALMILKEHPDVNLVLMDIIMPGMDGYTAMREIRKLETENRNIPIIALTAKAMRGDREKSIAAGASDYLPKPIDMSRLFSMMRVWLYR